MINVCAKYCGTTVLLESFNTQKEADDFMKNEYVMHYSDEYGYSEPDEVIYPNEMFIEDEIPFFQSVSDVPKIEEFEMDELPF